MPDPPSREELEAAHCWEAGDQVPGRPAMTAFRRGVRLQQARWREAEGHPIGTQPIVPDGRARLVGSRLPLDYAQETGATFLTPAARTAARARLSHVEPNQSIDHQRVWAELLWGPTLAFNLFGDLAADPARADRAVHAWWPDTPGSVVEVRFSHSPGWLDPAYLNSLRSFDAAFVLDLGDGTHGVIGVATKYYDWLKPEIVRPSNLPRYRQVRDRSGVFASTAGVPVEGRWALATTWLQHLLVLSMLQHPSGAWRWGRFVVVHPAGNVDVAAGCEQYRELLADDSTFATMTVEDLLDRNALPAKVAAAIRTRYLGPGRYG